MVTTCLGPGLVALGTAAAQQLEPLHTFDLLASELVESLGETVLLWIQQGDGLAMAAFREGSHPLRYVPALGVRLPASGWASSTSDGLTEGQLEPGVWLLAAPLDEHALLAVVGPAERLKGAAGDPRARDAARRDRRRRARHGGGCGTHRATRAGRLSDAGAGRQPLLPVGRRLPCQRAALVRLGRRAPSGWYRRRPPNGPSTCGVTRACRCRSANPHRRCGASSRAGQSCPSKIQTVASGAAWRAAWPHATRSWIRRACWRAARAHPAHSCGWCPNS